MIKGINHITLTVSDLRRSLTFYIEVLGFTVKRQSALSAYLVAGQLWLCLVEEAVEMKRSRDYTHIAFDVDPEDFEELQSRIKSSPAKIWQLNSSEGPSLYFEDLDGHRLEIHVGNLKSRLDSLVEKTS